MTATEAKRLLESVPEDEFVTGIFTNTIDKCCAIGHLARLTSLNQMNYLFDNCYPHADLYMFCYHEVEDVLGYKLSTINNDPHIGLFPQPTPKGRVLAALDMMIEKGH